MAFGKTFLLSLVTLVGLTFGGWILVLALDGSIAQIGTYLSTLPGIANAFFFPNILFPYPGDVYNGLIAIIFTGTLTAASLTLIIFLIAAPLLAAIVAGIVGENRNEVFFGWFLAAAVSMGIALTLIIIGFMTTYGGILPELIVQFIVGAATQALVYGCIGLLVARYDSF